MGRNGVAVLGYLASFLTALGLFLNRHHNLAFVLAYVSWFIVVVTLWRPNRKERAVHEGLLRFKRRWRSGV